MIEAILTRLARSRMGRRQLVARVARMHRTPSKFLFAPTPLINNKFWAAALKQGGYDAETLVTHHYPNNSRTDFDRYYEDLAPEGHWGASGLVRSPHYRDYLAFQYVLKHARVVHIPFTGGPLGPTPLWNLEAELYRAAGIKVVVIPYGGDAHMYSTIWNTSMRNALLIDYPAAARSEARIRERVEYWAQNADCVVCGALVYGMPRWDIATPSPLCIDTDAITAKSQYSMADGRSDVVRIAHAPNHRGFKGTEFVIQAVEALQAEGLRVELALMERMPNAEVMATLSKADALVEQLIAGGYALNAIEGMATGLPVLSNVEDEPRRLVFRRYSFAEECPILSTTPETVQDNIRLIVTRPDLRKQLGQASRAYAEKYHSFETARHMFSAIYDRILHGKSIDLMNLFHPLKSEYNRRRPLVAHPLRGGHLPVVLPATSAAIAWPVV